MNYYVDYPFNVLTLFGRALTCTLLQPSLLGSSLEDQSLLGPRLEDSGMTGSKCLLGPRLEDPGMTWSKSLLGPRLEDPGMSGSKSLLGPSLEDPGMMGSKCLLGPRLEDPGMTGSKCLLPEDDKDLTECLTAVLILVVSNFLLCLLFHCHNMNLKPRVCILETCNAGWNKALGFGNPKFSYCETAKFCECNFHSVIKFAKFRCHKCIAV